MRDGGELLEALRRIFERRRASENDEPHEDARTEPSGPGPHDKDDIMGTA